MATSNKLISVQHLVKEYNHGTVKALNDCNLDIAQGEVVAIIGPLGVWQVHPAALPESAGGAHQRPDLF